MMEHADVGASVDILATFIGTFTSQFFSLRICKSLFQRLNVGQFMTCYPGPNVLLNECFISFMQPRV